MLGWNDGTSQELFSLEELIGRFSMERVHKGGAKFDFEKAKWFNHEWIKKQPVSAYSSRVLELFEHSGISIPYKDVIRPQAPNQAGDFIFPPVAGITGDPELDLASPVFVPAELENTIDPPLNPFEKVLDLVKDRCTLLPDFVQQAAFFFQAPATIDIDSIKPKWTEAKALFFVEFIRQLQLEQAWDAASLETGFKEMAAAAAIKPGELLLPLRIMLVGGKFGPHVFDIVERLGREESISRIKHTLSLL